MQEACQFDEDPSDVPFAGVPCSIKECFALSGMPQSAGLYSRRDVVAQSDADSVALYRKAGAIPMGVTNTSELCMWLESRNSLYGQTNNPYDLTRTVGGSSGGEAAAVASGCAAFGLGSDVGGSIRMPAFFTGIFGHKPSSGLVSNVGQYPSAYGTAQRMLCTGPLTHHAEDLFPLLNVLAPHAHLVRRNVDLKKLRVLHITDNGLRSPSSDLAIAQEKVVSFLSQQGAEILSIKPPALRNSIQIWSSFLEGAGGPTFEEMLFLEGQRFSKEMVKKVVGRSRHTIPALILVGLERLTKFLPDQVQHWISEGDKLKEMLDALLDENTIALFPSYTRPAPRHKSPLATPLDFAYTAIINALELPTTQVPLGLNAKGLPLGVQVFTGHGQDALSIAMAELLEEEFGGWVPPQMC
jgi:fatty acid amide hydrolase 2